MSSLFAAIEWPFGVAAATAVGAGVAPVITPEVQDIINTVWKDAAEHGRSKRPGAGILAAGVAQGQVNPATAADWASQTGFGSDEFAALVAIANTGPGVASAFELFRRQLIDEAGFRRALKRQAIEPEWINGLVALRDVRLTPDVIANGVQQGHLPNDGILPPMVTGGPPFNIPLTTIDIDPTTEAEAFGVTRERLQVLTNLVGLPPGDQELLAMWNRGIITEEAVEAGIREGHRKTKWIPAVKELRKSVLSAQDYASARLRQWVTAEESYVGGALTGHSREQMDLLFLNRGRPASPTQMWRGWARGATGPRGVPVTYEDHAKAIAISDIRPEYAEMLWEIRFNYPALFQLNRLVAAGAVSADIAADWAHKSLYAPEVITALHAYWSQPAADAAQKWAARAKTQLWTAAHRAFIQSKVPDPEVVAALAAIPVTGAELNAVIELWTAERSITVSLLTPAEIRREYRKNVITLDEAVTQLEEHGYAFEDAQRYLSAL